MKKCTLITFQELLCCCEQLKYSKRTHANSSASQYFVHSMHHVNSKNFMRKIKVNVTA